MKIYKIKKHSGGERVIYAPSPEERVEYRGLLAQISLPGRPLASAHGFLPGRGIVTNAQPHMGAAVMISLDLSDFFDSVRPAQVRGRVPAAVMERCFLAPDGRLDPENGAPRQGLPTSPAVANLAATPLDEAVRKYLKKMRDTDGVEGNYTRYADDLSISFPADPGQEKIQKIKNDIINIISRCGFKPKKSKSKIRRATGGLLECCGVMVAPDGLRPSRRMRRKLRAAQHNLARAEQAGAEEGTLRRLRHGARGLAEFCQLRPPKPAPGPDKIAESRRWDEAAKLARSHNLRAPRPCKKSIPDTDLGDGCKITDDPAQIMLMSAATTGWTSCMKITGGEYRKGLPFWASLPGCSIAYRDGEGEYTLSGVTRPRMSERALVWALRDGRRCYGDVYSGRGHRMITDPEESPLVAALQGAGYLPAPQCSGALVEGHAGGTLPYLDNATSEIITLSESRKKAYRIKIR